ncbi:MAG TPA: LytTR family DNA-binding domain-containing protein [Opitutus sp.]|nr:LytTR family DNA-binding domain-containing protein [Opitutus sp.]
MNPPSPHRALIIDDEPIARRALLRLLADRSDVAVVGEAGTMIAARERLAVADYDLVLLDVQLRGGSGLDLVPHVAPGARIIFITAHDRYALRAFEVNALDYLLKPVEPARLAEALRRAIPSAGGAPAAAPGPAASLRIGDIVQIKTGPGQSRFAHVAELVLVTSDDNYSELTLAGGERLLERQTLAAWEARLPPSHFLRVHRRHIVNLRFVEGFTHESDETTLLRLAHLGEPVRARRHHWPAIQSGLATLGIRL